MKKLYYKLLWIHWRLTGYRELSELIRAHVGFNNALTPIGLERANELSLKEGEIRRKSKGIQK